MNTAAATLREKGMLREEIVKQKQNTILASVLLNAHAPRVDTVRQPSRHCVNPLHRSLKVSSSMLKTYSGQTLTAEGSGVGGERTAHRGKPV